MEVFCDKKTSKNIKIFECKKCNFICCKKGDWNRHILRPKHINLTTCDDSVTEKTYLCECGKGYQSRNGLWSHKKKCQNNSSPQNQTELIQFLLKENSEFKQIDDNVEEQNKHIMKDS